MHVGKRYTIEINICDIDVRNRNIDIDVDVEIAGLRSPSQLCDRCPITGFE